MDNEKTVKNMGLGKKQQSKVINKKENDFKILKMEIEYRLLVLTSLSAPILM